jgi:uncharacterized membrane protein
MTLTLVLILLAVGVVGAIAGVVYLHGHKAGVESAIARATTIPSGVAQKVDAVVPGAAETAQKAADKAATAATDAVNKVA